MIRQEVYGVDDIPGVSTTPYSVAERNCRIQRLQPVGQNRYAVFLVTECESICYSYERNSKDPRTSHTLNEVIDSLGNILESASVSYPRVPGTPGLPLAVGTEQQKLQILYSVTSYTNDRTTDTDYRLRQRCQNATFEVTGSPPAASFFALGELRAAFSSAAPINYEDTPNGSSQKRALKLWRQLFLRNDLSGPLPLLQMDPLGLPYEAYRLTFTGTLLSELYGTRITPLILAEGAYVESERIVPGVGF